MRLIHGDALDVLKTLPDASVDAVITDPPYGIALANHGNFSRAWTIEGDADQTLAQTVAAWADARRLPVCLFGSAYSPLCGRWRNVLAWDKGPAVGAGGDPATCWKRTFDLLFVRNNRPLLGGRDAAVLKFWQSPNFRRDHQHHPAEKPVELMRYLIRQLIPPGRIVLDPFMGSGTTGVACVREGRYFIGVEIDEEYYAIAQRRIAEAEACRDGRGVGELFDFAQEK